MNILSDREKIALVIGGILCLMLVITIFTLPRGDPLKVLLVGGITITISIIIIYVFIYQPMTFDGWKIPRYRKYYISNNHSFRPTVIPPSKYVKKTVTKGSCDLCEKPALMGFTCSYCGSYFCPEHRLPEKHHCPGIVKR